MNKARISEVRETCEKTKRYLVGSQDFSPGLYYGSFWSEKAYHGPLLDYNAGGAHHNRGAGSAALALWTLGKRDGDEALLRKAEAAFDWIASRQHPRGGYFEIQNNEKASDWECTGLEELSTIETAFAIRGLAHALLAGLPPKKHYMDCLKAAGMWQLSIERPEGSGVFPHHERSPYNTLNAASHAAETLAACHVALDRVYGVRINIFLQGALRAVGNILACQWDSGCFPYRKDCGATINYTSLVAWCMLNLLDILPEDTFHGRCGVPSIAAVRGALDKTSGFLRDVAAPDGSLLWEGNETSTAKHNMWTYIITANALRRIGGDDNAQAAERLLAFALSKRTASGLLPMRDEGEEITECAFMQADMLLFLLPFAEQPETSSREA